MEAVLLDLGIIKIYWYSVFIFFGILFGGNLVLKEAKKWGISEEFINNLFFLTIPIALLGARLYFVAFNWDYYSNNISEIFKVWEGGLAIHGGILFGLIFIILYSKKWKVPSLKLVDMAAVGLIFGQAIGRWGNFFNQEAYGPATTLEFLNKLHLPDFIINGMKINGTYYHPTFLYESLWCIIGFIILLIIRRLKYIKIGQITAVYLVWYGIGRFFIESLRTDSLMLGNLKIAQVVSVIMVVVGVVLFFIKMQGSILANRYNGLPSKDNV